MSRYCCPPDSFQKCMEIGNKGIEDLIPLLEQKSFRGRFVITDKGNISEFLQKTVGDVILNCPNGKVWSIEIKTEEENKYGNFFLETWSNLSRHKMGWMFTLIADFLWYYFQNEKTLYSMQLPKLKDWAFTKRRIYQFPEKKQGKNEQLNDTWGRCVPIPIIKKEVELTIYKISNGGPQ